MSQVQQKTMNWVYFSDRTTNDIVLIENTMGSSYDIKWLLCKMLEF